MTYLSQKDELLLQTFSIVAVLGALQENEFLNSEFFSRMKAMPGTKELIEQTGLGNQGHSLISLYAMLVVPWEYFAEDPAFSSDFDGLDAWIESRAPKTISNYNYKSRPSHGHQYCRHIRNAVAHGSVGFRAHDVVIFEDKSRNQKFYMELPLTDLNEFVNTKLLSIHLKVIKAINAKTSIP